LVLNGDGADAVELQFIKPIAVRWRIIDQTRFHRLDEARLGRWYLLKQLGCSLRAFIFVVVASYYSLVFFFKRSLNSRLKCRSLAWRSEERRVGKECRLV